MTTLHMHLTADWLSVEEAATLLKRDRATVRRWWQRGVLSGRQAYPGAWVEIRRASVQRYLDGDAWPADKEG